MKNVYLSILLIASVTFCSAQAPTGYYDSASGLTGESLKSALNNIIKGHTMFSYTSSATDVWDILKATDKDPNNSNNVILIYTGRSVNAAQEYNNGAGWTREHVWAKSRGDFGTSQGPGTDVHHLRPCDVSINSTRNNRWFAECDVPVYDDGVFTGSYTSTTDWVWEPRAAVKGDVARMIFYMATRYEGLDAYPDLEIIDYLPADDYTAEPIHALLSDLLAWHQADPVDSWEINRNNIIYTNYQHNRNPFIDHPEYVNYIWGGTTPPVAGLASPVTLTLVLDNYPYETSWNVKNNATGNFVTSGSGYTIKGATVTKSITLESGDYTFNIADTYGDGICCTQGNGSYTLTDAGGTQIATGGDFTYSDQVTFTIGEGGGDPIPDTSMPDGYCATKGNSISDEWIDLVNLGSINNSTGANGGYADFTSQSTALSSGSSYTINFSTGFSGTAYNEYWKIWIDYNRDGDFNDAGEEIAATSSSSSGTLSKSFTVPSTLSEGTTRMRVSMKYNAYPTSCETFTYGEVEDYAIVLSASKSGLVSADEIITLPLTERVVNLYPNPAADIINLQLPEAMQATVDVININGQIVKTLQVTEFGRISIADLPVGIYTMKISDGKSTMTERFIKQ